MIARSSWIGEAFGRKSRARTVAALLADQDRRAGDTSAHQDIKRRLADAETRLRRLREAIKAGAHPEALVDSINDAQAQRAAAPAELDAGGPAPDLMSDAELYARLDSVSDIKAELSREFSGSDLRMPRLHTSWPSSRNRPVEPARAELTASPQRKPKRSCVAPNAVTQTPCSD